MKLIAPSREEIPAVCNASIVRSTEGPDNEAERGGYKVHPDPAPPSKRAPNNRSRKLGGRSQNEMLLRRGNAISGAPISMGIHQFPKPPINPGMTK